MENLHYTPKHFMHMEDGEIRGERKTDTPSLVDVRGYMPLAKQVERAIMAGERLEAFRKGDWDSDNPDYDGEPSRLSDPDFMPSTDMEYIIQEQEQKLRELQAQQNSVVNQKVEQNAQQAIANNVTNDKTNETLEEQA